MNEFRFFFHNLTKGTSEGPLLLLLRFLPGGRVEAKRVFLRMSYRSGFPLPSSVLIQPPLAWRTDAVCSRP